MALKLADRPDTESDSSTRDDEIARLEDMYNAPAAWDSDIPDSTADLPHDMQADYSAPRDMSRNGDNRDGLGTKPAGAPDFRPAAVADALRAAEANAGGAQVRHGDGSRVSHPPASQPAPRPQPA